MTNSGTGTPAQIQAQIAATLAAYNLPYQFSVDQITGNATFMSGPFTGQHIISSPFFDASLPNGQQNLLTILAVATDSSGATGNITVVTGPDSGEQINTSPSIGWKTILIGTLLVGIPLPGFGGGAADAAAGPSADLGADAGATGAVAGPSGDLAAATGGTGTAAAGGTTAATTATAGGATAAVGATAAGAGTVGTVATVTGLFSGLARTFLGGPQLPASPVVAPAAISPFMLLALGAVAILLLERREG